MTERESAEPHDSKSPEELEAAFFRWGLQWNLNHYVRFHNLLKASLGALYKDPELRVDPAARETLKLYEKLNASNTLLLVLAYLEEMLILFWRRVMSPKPVPSGKREGIDRFKPVLQELGVDLGTSDAWSKLKDAAEIRNCILHTNGRVSLTARPKKVQEIIRRNDGLETVNDRLRVTPVFLRQTVNALQRLREEMIRKKERLQLLWGIER